MQSTSHTAIRATRRVGAGAQRRTVRIPTTRTEIRRAAISEWIGGRS